MKPVKSTTVNQTLSNKSSQRSLHSDQKSLQRIVRTNRNSLEFRSSPRMRPTPGRNAFEELSPIRITSDSGAPFQVMPQVTRSFKQGGTLMQKSLMKEDSRQSISSNNRAKPFTGKASQKGGLINIQTQGAIGKIKDTPMMRPRIIAASAREDGDFRDLLARNSLPKAPIILEKKKLKNFKPPSSGRGGESATLD